MTDGNKITRLDILNQRDEFFAFISSEMDFFQEFLSTKSSKQWDLNSSILEDVYEKFLNLSKPALRKIKELRESTITKRSEVIDSIKLYSKLLSSGSDDGIKQKFAELTVQYENELTELKNTLSGILEQKDEIIQKKQEYDELTKSKLQSIRAKISSNKELNVDVEEANIKEIIIEHKSFIKTEIEENLVIVNTNLKELNKKIKDREEKHIKSTYEFLDRQRSFNKEEFLILVSIEKDIILKALKFQDFLEDVENFYNDQVTTYNILFKSKKIIKLNKTRSIFKGANDVIIEMASTERIFDEVNKESLKTKYLIEGKKTDTLKQIQSNLIGASEISTEKLSEMIDPSADIQASPDIDIEEGNNNG